MAKENIRNPVICSLCGEKKSLEEMHLDKKTKKLICDDCFNDPLKKFMPNANKPKESEFIEPKVTYMCQSCGFSFSRSKIRPLRCPYCASNSIIIKDEVTSDKLLDLED